METLIWVATALAAGALARVVTRSRGRGFVGDTVLGALGSISGAWALRIVYGEVPTGGLAHIATALVGAVILVAAGRIIVDVARGAGQLAGDGQIANALPDFEAQIRRLSAFERTVVNRVLGRLPRDPAELFQEQRTLGERVADRVAVFGGSWTFLGCFAAFMLAWMFLNTQTARPADPYPFILLNLILSCLAAVQAPVIMMSQHRQASKDRFDAQQDYQVNLRAEMQITELHLKMDDARDNQWHALIELHREQLEILKRIETAITRAGGAG